MVTARFARILGAILVAGMISWLCVRPVHDVHIGFQARTESGGAALLEYSASASDTRRFPVRLQLQPDQRFWSYTVRLPDQRRPLHQLALVSQARGQIRLRQATIGLERQWPSPAALPVALYGADLNEDVVLAPQARIELAIPPGFSRQLQSITWAKRLFAFLGALVLIGMAGALQARLRKGATTSSDDGRYRFAPLAEALSDPLTLIVDRRLVAVVALATLLTALGVAARVHQSSIALWDGYLPRTQTATADSVLAGTPRATRSDEWLVHTPWMLSQMATGAHIENPSIGAGAAPLLTSVPVGHAVAWFQPEFWGFELLGTEHGYSWFWMYKLFGLLLGVFLLLSILTRGDFAVSLVGALSVWLSSYVQWWFSTNLPELLIGFCLAMIGLIHILQGRTRAACVVGTAALVLGAATFVFQFYPPFQVPLGYLALAIVAGLAADPARRIRFRQNMGRRLVCLLVATLVLGWLAAAFWHDAGATIGSLMHTAYPGTRVSVGGGESWRFVFSGLFEAWRIGEETIPKGTSNASEASNFALLFPFVAVALLWTLRKARVDGVVAAITVFCVVLAAWMSIPLPAAVSVPLAKWSLLSFVPPHRAVLALGFASCLLVPAWIACVRRRPDRVLPLVLVPLAGLVVTALGVFLAGTDPSFFTPWRIALGTMVAVIAAYALARGSLHAFAAAVVLLAVPAATVNPWAHGLAPLRDKPAIHAIVEANRAARTGQMWLVVGSFVLPQALKANGIPTFGGATYLSDAGRMRLLDPSGAYASVWNRYGHIQVESQPGIAAPIFTLIDDPSLYAVKLDVCSDAVSRIGIGFVAYTSEAPAPDRRCLDQIGAPVEGLWLYRRRPSVGANGSGG